MWADLFSKAIACRVKEPTGKGWLTHKQFVEKTGVGTDKAHQLLRAAVKNGSFERFDGSQECGKRGTRQTWYRPVTK